MGLAPALNKAAWDKVKQYDPALELDWDCRINRWKLYRRSAKKKAWDKRVNGRTFIVTVQNKDGSFRPVDNRLLYHLMDCDTWRFKDAAEMDRNLFERERIKEQRDDEQLTKDLEERGKYLRKAAARFLDDN